MLSTVYISAFSVVDDAQSKLQEIFISLEVG